MDAQVDEQISHCNKVEKQYEEVECVAVKIINLSIICYDSICSICCLGGIFCHPSHSAIPRKKIGKPKEEIKNLNRFKYMYLSDLKVPYF
jgi:hypothetical protein